MDIVDCLTRSRMMSQVGQRDTAPEMALRRELHALGLRYRLHDRRLAGSPDIVFPAKKCAVFVHGCYWHCHGCRLSTVPKTRTEFWVAKFAANRERDERVVASLLSDGWRVLTVWQCSLRTAGDVSRVARKVEAWLVGGSARREVPSSAAASTKLEA